jgi:Ni/Fe-hydrogenase subunit HybB-like protein
MSAHAAPIGGPIANGRFVVLMLFMLAVVVLLAVRLAAGLGAVSAMSNGYPWGIWKPMNVVTFTGIGAGAFASAILCYVLNRGEYHRLVRSAVLVGAVSYTLGAFSVAVDLGRWWNIWEIPVLVWRWNGSSILLEVALCVMTYMLVLWVEFTPAVVERLERIGPAWVRRGAAATGRVLKRMLPWVIPIAMVLPTMHQSSLGSLFILAPTKLHPLWHTSFLPALFLLSCLSMGYAALVVIDSIESLVWGSPRDLRLLGRLGVIAACIELAWLAIRLVDLGVRGRLVLVLTSGPLLTGCFLAEVLIFGVTGVLVLLPRWRASMPRLLATASFMLVGGALYRMDTYLTAFNPGPGWHYFPTVWEMLFSLGLAAIGVLIFTLAVKLFPVFAPGGIGASRPPRATVTKVATETP